MGTETLKKLKILNEIKEEEVEPEIKRIKRYIARNKILELDSKLQKYLKKKGYKEDFIGLTNQSLERKQGIVCKRIKMEGKLRYNGHFLIIGRGVIVNNVGVIYKSYMKSIIG